MRGLSGTTVNVVRASTWNQVTLDSGSTFFSRKHHVLQSFEQSRRIPYYHGPPTVSGSSL